MTAEAVYPKCSGRKSVATHNIVRRLAEEGDATEATYRAALAGGSFDYIIIGS